MEPESWAACLQSLQVYSACAIPFCIFFHLFWLRQAGYSHRVGVLAHVYFLQLEELFENLASTSTGTLALGQIRSTPVVTVSASSHVRVLPLHQPDHCPHLTSPPYLLTSRSRDPRCKFNSDLLFDLPSSACRFICASFNSITSTAASDFSAHFRQGSAITLLYATSASDLRSKGSHCTTVWLGALQSGASVTGGHVDQRTLIRTGLSFPEPLGTYQESAPDVFERLCSLPA